MLVRRSALRALLALALLLALPSRGWGQGKPPSEASQDEKRRAQSAYDRGAERYRAHELEAAKKAFEESYSIVQSPASRFMLASTLRDQRQYAAAYEAFDAAEQLARTLTGDPTYKKIAEESAKERDKLRERLAFVVVRVEGAEADTRVLVGKREIPRDRWGKPFAVPPGANALILVRGRTRDMARWVTVPKGTTEEVELGGAAGVAPSSAPTAATATPAATAAPASDPSPAPPPEPAAPATSSATATSPPPSAASNNNADAAEPSAERSSLLPLALVLGGVGVAGMGVFGVAGAMNMSTHDSLDRGCPEGACPPERREDIDAGRTQQTVANIGLVVGAVALTGAATVLVIHLARGKSRARASSGASFGVGPAGARLRASF